MTTAIEIREMVLSKAGEDDAFRARLIADPKAAISAEIGAEIPDGFYVSVHEDNATTTHLVLPPAPALTEAELEQVVGAGNLWENTMPSHMGGK